MNKLTREEEALFVEEERDWAEVDQFGMDKGAVVIDKEKAIVEEARFVGEEGEWVDHPGVDKGATTIDKEKAEVEEKRFFEAEKKWVEGEIQKDTDIGQIVTEQIKDLRKELSDASKAAQAIDRGAPWMEISQLAEEEGLHQISSLLFEAEQQGLEDDD